MIYYIEYVFFENSKKDIEGSPRCLKLAPAGAHRRLRAQEKEMSGYYWSALIFGIIGGILLQGLRKIPADPPHKGQKTKLGKRVPGEIYNEGWNFVLGYPYLFGFILVNVERITFEFVSEKTRTPDRAESRIPVLVTVRPLSDHLIEYIDSGREKGVREQLQGKIMERVREWTMGLEEGPADWVELNQAHLEAVSVLVKKIAYNSLTPIPQYAQQVPTWIWLRYYNQPRPTVFLKNEKLWGKNKWYKVRKILDEIESTHGLQAIEDLKVAVEGRREDIDALRTGTGKIVLHDLGVRLERLNLGDIDVLGEVGKQAEGEAKEEQERQKEELELKFVKERIEEFMSPPLNYTREQARDIVQVERDKVVRAIDDKQISFDATTAQIVANIFGRKP